MMGNNSTSQSSIPDSLKISPYFKFLSKFFQDISTIIKDGSRIVAISKFKEVFADENVSIVELLYKYFIVIATDHVCHEMQKVSFISGFDKLLKLEYGSQDMAAFYIEVFSDGKVELTVKDITAILCGVHSVQLKQERNLLPESDTHFEALAKSLFCKGADLVNRNECVNQVFQLWPRLFNHVHSWILRSLSKHGGSNDIVLHKHDCTRIHLLSSSASHDILDPIALWLLSVSIPTLYLKSSRENEKKHEEYFTSELRKLYDSNEHGLSHNRFKHHCFSYRGPTLMAILLGNDVTLVLAFDVEWRESTKCFGDTATRLYQVSPQFKVLSEKNIVLFNERSRGLPVGLILGNNPSKPQVSLLDGLTSAKLGYLGGEETSVQKIQVWGCAGARAETAQKQQQNWEKRQAEQLQKVVEHESR